MTKERETILNQIEEKLGTSFADRRLLDQALTHSSYVHEHSAAGSLHDNERLEFLGDAIIDFG